MKTLIILSTLVLIGCGHPNATITPSEQLVVIPVVSPIEQGQECIPFIRKHGHSRKCYLCVINNEQIKLCEVKHEK